MRFLQFLPALERQGFTFDVQPLLDNDYVRSLYGGPPVGAGRLFMSYVRRFSALRRRMRYDVVWLEKEALPWLPAWVEIARLQGMPYVVDYDDAWFHRYESHWLSPLLGHKIDAVMRVAHTVVAGNDFLARRARQAGARHVEIVPSAIDLDALPRSAASRGCRTADQCRLDRHSAQRALSADRRAGAARVPTASSCMSSAAPVPAELRRHRAESFPWTEDSEIARIAAFDVGIMPLHDTPWERGKCAYKLLQVMAAGKPVIASPVGANRQVVRHGVNGFLADTPERMGRRAAPARRSRTAPPHGRGGAQDRRGAVFDRRRRAAACRDPAASAAAA